MLGNKTKNILAPAADKPIFAPKTKGDKVSTTPVVDPALKALAYNRRKKFKLG